MQDLHHLVIFRTILTKVEDMDQHRVVVMDTLLLKLQMREQQAEALGSVEAFLKEHKQALGCSGADQSRASPPLSSRRASTRPLQTRNGKRTGWQRITVGWVALGLIVAPPTDYYAQQWDVFHFRLRLSSSRPAMFGYQ